MNDYLQLILSQRNGSNAQDDSAYWWDEFDLMPVITSSVKITILSVFAATLNNQIDFVEVEFNSGKNQDHC